GWQPLNRELVEQYLGLASNRVVLDLMKAVATGAADGVVQQVESFVSGGGNVMYLGRSLISMWRMELLRLANPGLAARLAAKDTLDGLAEAGLAMSLQRVQGILEALVEVQQQVGLASHPALQLE